jgi:hypothetical protein
VVLLGLVTKALDVVEHPLDVVMVLFRLLSDFVGVVSVVLGLIAKMLCFGVKPFHFGSVMVCLL